MTYVQTSYSSSDCTGPSITKLIRSYSSCLSTDDQSYIQTCYGYPQASYCVNESSLVYSPHGPVSIMGTLAKCMENMGGDIVFYPGYNTGSMVNVSVYVSLNNLILIDEVTNTVTLDVYMYLSWIDPRLVMPALFNQLNFQYLSGIDITDAVNQQNIYGVNTNIWLPDVLYPGMLHYNS